MSQKTLERLEHLPKGRDSWRAVCAERCKHLFGGEGLVLLSNQDLASYPTQPVRLCRIHQTRNRACAIQR